jgi:hypothetical protein
MPPSQWIKTAAPLTIAVIAGWYLLEQIPFKRRWLETVVWGAYKVLTFWWLGWMVSGFVWSLEMNYGYD